METDEFHFGHVACEVPLGTCLEFRKGIWTKVIVLEVEDSNDKRREEVG